LRQILKDVASQLGCSIDELIGSLDLCGQGCEVDRSDEHAAHHPLQRIRRAMVSRKLLSVGEGLLAME
jgi:hypothetical protein